MQGEKPSISIITVCYNAASDLERTIQSVHSQTYPYLQYIVVDGASTDHTPLVLKQYHNNIDTLISEPDHGIYDAMNKGMKYATGDYLCFMNAGDTFHSETTLADVFGQLPCGSMPGVIYGDTDLVDSTGTFIRKRRLTPPEVLTAKSFQKGMLVCHQSFYARRDLALPYDLSYRFSADIDWCIKVLKQSSHNHNTHMTLTDYLHIGTTTHNHKASLKERFKIMVKHYGILSTLIHHAFFALRTLWMQ